MIVFLTLAYIALLFVLKLLGLIRFNLAWKLSPIAWMLLLFVTLFIPMQWGAPTGPVGVFRYVIEIIPAVSGQVLDVPVQPLTEVKEGDVLFQIDPEPFQEEVDRLKAAYVDAQQQPELLAASLKIAEASLAKAKANQKLAQRDLERSVALRKRNAVSKEEYEGQLLSAELADRTVEEAAARLEQAELELSASTAEGENTAVAIARNQLERAQYDLEHATVRAPTDGVVQQLALRPGTRVAAMPLRGALLFVERDRTRISVAVKQNQLRYVRPGQSAEVVLKYLPGMTLKAKVERIAAVTSGGQVQSSGVVEDLSSKQENAEAYQVILAINDDRVSPEQLPGGAVGVAAIYTDRVQFAHIIRRVMMRMQAWLNYVL